MTTPVPPPTIQLAEPPPARLPLCSDLARERQDPLVGTAVAARRWLLIEHPGPWAFDALGGSGIARDVQVALVMAVRASAARILLIRRHGRRRPGTTRAWAVVDHSPAVPDVWDTWSQDSDLLPACAALTRTAPGDVVAGSGSADFPLAAKRPVVLVCAHGRHDTCCAVRGRPLVDELARQWPDETWECSHVGGCRFAGNVLLLPEGAYYGNLDPVTAPRVVAAHLRGQLMVEHLRGMSTEVPVVQAAVSETHRRYGPAGARDIVGAGSERLGGDRWRVRLSGTGPVPPVLEALVVRSHRPAARLTCRAPMDSSANAFDVVDLIEVPGTTARTV